MKYEHFLSSFKTAVYGGSLLQSKGRLRLEKLVELDEKTVSISVELSSFSDETPNVIPTKTLRRWSMRLLFGTAVMGFGLLFMAETINGLYKAEVIHRSGPWKSFDAVE